MKIDYWDADVLEMVSSQDDYQVLETNLLIRTEDDRLERTTGYVHVKTGILTTDVQAFEEWIYP